MHTDIQQYGARPMAHQVVTMPSPQPKRGLAAVTGKANRKRRQGNKQRACLVIQKHQLFRSSSHSGTLRDFERRNQSYRCSEKGGSGHHLHSETHQTDAHRFTLRGYELFWHDRADQHKEGIVTLVQNTIPAVEVGRSGGDSEYLAIRVVQGREITVINYYCPPDKDLQLHTLPLVKQNLLITSGYLFQRSDWVRLDRQISSSVKSRGVPQGGVISPILFIIFTDDICTL